MGIGATLGGISLRDIITPLRVKWEFAQFPYKQACSDR